MQLSGEGEIAVWSFQLRIWSFRFQAFRVCVFKFGIQVLLCGLHANLQAQPQLSGEGEIAEEKVQQAVRVE